MFERLFKRERTFEQWNDYKAKMQFLEEFRFQQGVRRESLRNSVFF